MTVWFAREDIRYAQDSDHTLPGTGADRTLGACGPCSAERPDGSGQFPPRRQQREGQYPNEPRHAGNTSHASQSGYTGESGLTRHSRDSRDSGHPGDSGNTQSKPKLTWTTVELMATGAASKAGSPPSHRRMQSEDDIDKISSTCFRPHRIEITSNSGQ